MRSLRELDQEFLAKAAPKVSRIAHRLRGRPVPHPGTTAKQLVRDIELRNLSALDDKYASRGFLGFLREVPQLMAVIIAFVLVAGSLGAIHLLELRQTADEQTVAAPTTGGGGSTATTTIIDDGTLGPSAGDSVPSYLTTSDKTLSAVAEHDSRTQRYALVSLSRYETPAQALEALTGYDVSRVWVRDRQAGRDAPGMPLDIKGDLMTALTQAYASTATIQKAAAASYQKLADTTTNDPQFKEFYTHYAAISREQSRAFGSSCTCIYSAIVKASGKQLAVLRARDFVRVVEVTATDVDLKSVDITTLLPEVKGIQPQPQPVVDPP